MGDWIGEHRGVVIGVAILVALVVVLLATGQKESLVIGVIAGAAYGLLALGLVLIYKSSGVFNFAQGEFGTVAVYVLYLLHFDVPYGVAVLGALVAAVLMGVLVERLVVRPLFTAPRVTLLVATAGRRAARHRDRDLVRRGNGATARPGAADAQPGQRARRAHLGSTAPARRRARRARGTARAVLPQDQPRPRDPRARARSRPRPS